MTDSDPERWAALSLDELQEECDSLRQERDTLRRKLDERDPRGRDRPTSSTFRLLAFLILGPRLSRRLRRWMQDWHTGEKPVPIKQTAGVADAFIQRLIGSRRTLLLVTLITAIPALATFSVVLRQNRLMAEQLEIAEKDAREKVRFNLLTKLYDREPEFPGHGQVQASVLRIFLDSERENGLSPQDGPRINLMEAPLSGVNVTAMDFSEVDLRWAQMPKALSTCQFFRTDCRAAVFHNSSVMNARITESGFIGSRWSGLSSIVFSHVEDSLFENSTMSGISISDSTVIASQFQNADLSGVQFRGVRLQDVNLSGANLRGAIFETRWLSGAEPLPDAPPRETPDSCELMGVDLTGADLRGTVFNKSTVFSDVTINGTRIDAKTVLPDGVDRKNSGFVEKSESATDE